MARVVSSACAGVQPETMGKGPIPAVKKALVSWCTVNYYVELPNLLFFNRVFLKDKAGWSLDQVDLFELNEAFAAQSMCVVDTLSVDKSKVNVQGGSLTQIIFYDNLHGSLY